jgi:hypothetical protein
LLGAAGAVAADLAIVAALRAATTTAGRGRSRTGRLTR